MGSEGDGREPQDLFDGCPQGLALFGTIERVVAEIGNATIRVTKSQVAFRRRRGFAYVWRPAQYVASDVPAVLSIPLPREVASGRFKSVAHPAPHVWMHHLELRDETEVDAEVRAWLTEAYDNAG